MVTENTRTGDVICLLLVGDAPVVLRQHGSDGCYRLVRDCHVHGIVRGEVLENDDCRVEDHLLEQCLALHRLEQQQRVLVHLMTTLIASSTVARVERTEPVPPYTQKFVTSFVAVLKWPYLSTA